MPGREQSNGVILIFEFLVPSGMETRVNGTSTTPQTPQAPLQPLLCGAHRRPPIGMWSSKVVALRAIKMAAL